LAVSRTRVLSIGRRYGERPGAIDAQRAATTALMLRPVGRSRCKLALERAGGAAMDFRFTPQQEQFRSEIRGFLDEELADRSALDAQDGVSQAFSKKLAAKHWIGTAWPVEYGGRSLTPLERLIFTEEMILKQAPTGYHFVAERQMGPSLIAYGTEAQKREHLQKIINADESWAIGMSEPGAGSDLAGVQTRAVRDGDNYVVNGQKIWTSNAHHADLLWLVCRTDPDAPKHRGISVLIVDLHTPGVTVRPLVNMGNQHHFNEVFFEDVRVPAENLVGEENRGWYITANNLDHERSGIERIASSALLFNDVMAFAKRFRNDPRAASLRVELAERYLELQTGRLLSYRVAWQLSTGRVPNYEASMSKVFGTEWTQRMCNSAMHMVATFGLANDPQALALRQRIEGGYLNAVSLTIAGGTSEIQRNIIATRGLGLPRG
jgi:3-oxocholest-4-en-26-oyl-CoA dehydrogenase alpha subunit